LKVLGLWEQEDDWRYSSDRIPDILEQAIHLHKIIEEKTLQFTSDELVKWRSITVKVRQGRSGGAAGCQSS